MRAYFLNERLPSSNAEIQAPSIDISTSHAGRRSLLLHHPSESCPDLIVSSRAEQGASVATAVPQHHDASLSATVQDKHAETPAEAFWQASSNCLKPGIYEFALHDQMAGTPACLLLHLWVSCLTCLCRKWSLAATA